MDTSSNPRSIEVICPACKGTATGPKYPGTGGCNVCNGNGVIMKAQRSEFTKFFLGEDDENMEKQV
jgi:DnaJ-class molecular chaperone